MARPTARVLALLEILEAGGLHQVPGLAARLGVNERTVRRYITHLLELGVPVETIRGRHGGYRLAPMYRLPPLMLTEDEAVTVALALSTAGDRQTEFVAPTRGDHGGGLQATDPGPSGRAAAKIRRVLPATTIRRLDDLLATLAWTTAPQPRAGHAVKAAGAVASTDGGDTRTLLLFAAAVRARRPVAFSYIDRHGRPSERTVEPYGIVAHADRWYVPGQDTVLGEVRVFRLDRISRPALRAGAFAIPSDLDPATAVLDSLATTPWQHQVQLRIAATPEQIRQHFPPGLALVAPAPDADGWVRVELRAERLDWVPPLLAGLGTRLRVDQPPQLRWMVHDYAARMANDTA